MFSPELKKGSIELLTLSLLRDRPRHGYEIGKLMELGSEGRLSFTVSALYPTLYRMEKKEWIKGRWVEREGQRRRYYYRLMPKGRAVLLEQEKNWREYGAAINQILGPSHA
jgi:PadR family transcriptional regulator, regulatory protein PadR